MQKRQLRHRMESKKGRQRNYRDPLYINLEVRVKKDLLFPRIYHTCYTVGYMGG